MNLKDDSAAEAARVAPAKRAAPALPATLKAGAVRPLREMAPIR